MKSINIIKITIVSLFILVSATMNAKTLDNENLIQKMSNDDDVAAFLTKSYALAFAVGSGSTDDLDTLNKESKKLLEDFTSSLTQDSKKVNEKYPEFSNMNKEAKKETLREIIRRSSKVREYFKCFGVAITSEMAGCLGLAAALLVQGKKRFFRCGGVAVAVDVAEIVATDGAAIPVVEVELKEELKFCWRMAFRNFGSNVGVCMAAAVPLALTACAFIVNGH